MSYAARGGFAGWAVAVSGKRQEFKIWWKHPQRLIATHAELDDTLGLSKENSPSLCDHGAEVSLPLPSTKSEPTPAAGLAGTTNSVAALATTSAIETPMLAVSAILHARIQDVDWTVDGVRSLAWPSGDHDLEARNSEGMTMLLSAAKHGRGHMVDSFLSAGVNRNAVDDRGYTAVCWDAARGFSTILRALLFSHEGANPDHVTSDGDTPAILAARGGHLCAIAELEEGGADLNMGNHPGETPLIAASRAGKTDLVAFLAGLTGTGLERRDGVGGTTALAAAASFGRNGCAKSSLLRARTCSYPPPTAARRCSWRRRAVTSPPSSCCWTRQGLTGRRRSRCRTRRGGPRSWRPRRTVTWAACGRCSETTVAGVEDRRRTGRRSGRGVYPASTPRTARAGTRSCTRACSTRPSV
ncbi:unnamed protein product [Ectocarpus sp. 12 AP-2014]